MKPILTIKQSILQKQRNVCLQMWSAFVHHVQAAGRRIQFLPRCRMAFENQGRSHAHQSAVDRLTLLLSQQIPPLLSSARMRLCVGGSQADFPIFWSDLQGRAGNEKNLFNAQKFSKVCQMSTIFHTYFTDFWNVSIF